MSKLKCVLFCDFHPLLGPQVAYQAPVDFITKEQIDSIAPYIIPKPQFQGRLISFKAYGFTFMGYPIKIDNKKYDRNALLFNALFVFNENDCVQEFESVVTKLAGYLTTLELETEYIWNSKTKRNLQSILTKILEDISSLGECTIPVDHCNTIFLKVVKLPKEPPIVYDDQVPVFLWSKSAIENQHWDLTAQRIIPCIDGCNHVQKIAFIAEVDLSIVRSAIQTLLFYGVVALVPIFLYSNKYAVKPKINNLLKDPSMRNECIAYVSQDSEKPSSFHNIFKLYCELGPGISVNDLCNRHDPVALGINIQRLILYGLIKKFVHNLNKYPVYSSTNQITNSSIEYLKYFNGCHSYSKICCMSVTAGESMHIEEIKSTIDNDPNVILIWK
ncbi:GATOR1 complex protein NPRL2-like [Hydra vulgaris]|uniref:GATOR1 complex protein NPRL2-like n=1 Tax=Hydra vulgaris TaxID=6087 RepID=A0ABM4DNT3_HYDVU